MALPLVWGATDAEVRRRYPADDALPGHSSRDVVLLTRAVGVDAAPEHVWRWTCQIAVAPYSYDWIDNLGRRSPRDLTPGAERLEVGQQMAYVFTLTSFDAPHQWTAVTDPRGERLFGPVAMTYVVEPDGDGSRLVCRLAMGRRGGVGRVRGTLLAWGDLVMMRKQLLTLKELAETTR